jgi:predicted DsbA family dithiol-disulfide isomerase
VPGTENFSIIAWFYVRQNTYYVMRIRLMTTKTTISVDIFSDVICPWCMIGKKRLEDAVELHGGISLRINWRAFLLNPNMPSEGMDRQTYIQKKFGNAGQSFYARIAATGKEVGIDFDFDAIRRTPDSRPAISLVLAADKSSSDVKQDIFNAYFQQGIDISNDAFLADLAGKYQIPHPSSEAVRSKLEKDLSEAQRLGIQGVPYFVFENQWALSGAHPRESFLPLFDATMAQKSNS